MQIFFCVFNCSPLEVALLQFVWDEAN
uniref:Uncharacterized protein n=1 Tax=Anguilla anguilla TaxID=7936 RepID=A0A0E9RTQ3_ANGAN